MKRFILIVFFVFSINTAFAVTEDDYFRVMGEIYFRFQNPGAEINEISRIISISGIANNWIYAYANKKEFQEFLSLNIPYEVLEHPGYAVNINQALKFSLATVFSNYPSYTEYIDLMNQYQSLHPDICEIYRIGTSVLGREILCARITGLTDTFYKPKVFLTSTIHGNEPAGFVMMLYLIDYLVENYGADPLVTSIVDRTEIWINPLANPDGTYWAGNETVFGARRYNANNVDLNRNFPDPSEGEHPDGNQWQAETISMMNFADTIALTLSANFHSGAEVVNYPWDTWEKLHPDNDWFISVSRIYADTVHLHCPAGYLDDLNDGITNGYAWYRITGGRQDYMNYFQHCREITVEISEYLFPQNPAIYWTYNKDAIIEFISRSHTGICGTVYCGNSTPVLAKIEIPGKDSDNSFVFSEKQTGKFFRLLLPGKYNLVFSAPYHYRQEMQDIQVIDGSLTAVNVILEHALKGDPSADGVIDISDVILCLKMAIGLSEMDTGSSDMNSDGIVDISDVILILRMCIGL